MPEMHTALQKVNAALAPGNIASVDSAGFTGGNDLADALDTLPGVSLGASTKSFVRGWPSALQAAILAAINDNLARDASARVPIVMSWTPGYDYDVRIWDIRNTESTHGEITVHLTSRYPADPHPVMEPVTTD